jgi:hypothetical protein
MFKKAFLISVFGVLMCSACKKAPCPAYGKVKKSELSNIQPQ